MKIIITVLVLFSFLIISGCSEKNKANNYSPAPGYVQNNNRPKVGIINYAQLDSIIYNRGDKSLFVNVWATWAKPSVEELSDIKLLYDKFKDNDVDFLSLSVDLTSKIDSVVIPFLQREKISFPVNVIEERSGMQIMRLLSPRWNGAVPASFIFDKYGRREIFILGRQSFINLSKGIDSVRVL